MFFEDVLQAGGFFAGYSLVIFLGVIAGVLGIFCKKGIKNFNGDWDWEDRAYFGLFIVFLCSVGIYIFSLPIFIAGEKMISGVFNTLIILILFRNFSFRFSNEEKKGFGFLIAWVSAAFIVSLFLSMFLLISSDDVRFYQFSQKQKAGWWIEQNILKIDSSQDEINTGLEKAKKYNYLPVSVEGIANLRLSKKAEAAENFRAYTENVLTDKHFWIGVAEYYKGNFLSASRAFHTNKSYDFGIFSLFQNGSLSLREFSELMKNREIMRRTNVPNNILGDIEEQLISQKIISGMNEAEKLILERISQIEDVIRKKDKDIGQEIDEKMFETILSRQKALIPTVENKDEKIFYFFLSILPLFTLVTIITGAIVNKKKE